MYSEWQHFTRPMICHALNTYHSTGACLATKTLHCRCLWLTNRWVEPHSLVWLRLWHSCVVSVCHLYEPRGTRHGHIEVTQGAENLLLLVDNWHLWQSDIHTKSRTPGLCNIRTNLSLWYESIVWLSSARWCQSVKYFYGTLCVKFSMLTQDSV